MRRKPFFSVVIPTLNEEKFVPRLLRDIHNQSEKDFEVIVVDGKSTDDTLKRVAEHLKILPLRIITAKSAHVSMQRNIGAKSARGEYLAFIDADSRISKSYLSRTRSHIEKSRYLILMPSMAPPRGEHSLDTAAMFNIVNTAVEISQKIGNKPFSTTGSMFVERNFFSHIGGFDEKLYIAEDHEIISRAKSYGVAAKYLKDVKLMWNLRRFKREGRLHLLAKYAKATVHYLSKGSIYDRVIEYEMGGKLYKISGKKQTLTFNKVFQKNLKILSQMKLIVEKAFKE